MRHRAAITIFIGLLTIVSRAGAQPPTEPWMQAPVDASAWGTGGAGSAVLGPFIGTYNPGGLGVYALTGQSAFAYADHGDLAFDREHTNTAVVVSTPSWALSQNPHGPRFAAGLTYRDQRAGIRYVRLTNGSTVDFMDHIHSYILAAGIDYGVQIGAGFAFERVWNSVSEEHANGYDVGLCARVPLLSAATRFGWLKQHPHWESLTPDVIVIVSHAWTNIGEFESGDDLPGANVFGLSAEGVLTYRHADIVRFLYARDAVSDRPKGTDRTRSGIRIDILGVLQIMQGAYSVSGGSRDYDTDAISYHSRGLTQWLGIAFADNAPSRWRTALEALDVYYTTASYDEIEGSDAVVNEFGVIVDASRLLWNRK